MRHDMPLVPMDARSLPRTHHTHISLSLSLALSLNASLEALCIRLSSAHVPAPARPRCRSMRSDKLHGALSRPISGVTSARPLRDVWQPQRTYHRVCVSADESINKIPAETIERTCFKMDAAALRRERVKDASETRFHVVAAGDLVRRPVCRRLDTRLPRCGEVRTSGKSKVV